MDSLMKAVIPIIEEQKAIEDLSYEVEKVLQYYEEHPQYPLDYNKIRRRIQEVNARLSKLREDIQHMAEQNS
jgi:hypothetical protein